jgi:hypothetical protein
VQFTVEYSGTLADEAAAAAKAIRELAAALELQRRLEVAERRGFEDGASSGPHLPGLSTWGLGRGLTLEARKVLRRAYDEGYAVAVEARAEAVTRRALALTFLTTGKTL